MTRKIDRRQLSRAGAVVLCLGLSLAAATALPAGAVGAGTNIANAKQLTASASGSLASMVADDWYVVYPATSGGVIQVKATNTTAGSPTCSALEVAVRDSSGTMLAGTGQGPNTSFSSPVSKVGSDRYFIELKTANCNPQAGHAVTYSLQLQAGGGGVAPAPVAGAVAAGASIGSAWPPLQGASSYTGTLASSLTDAWYVLDKHSSTSPATIRVENTTVVGSTTCVAMSVALRNTDGNMVSGSGLNDNTAVTLTVVNPGRYYLELTDEGCAAGGTTYRIEPEPAAGWDHPAQLPTKSMPVGATLAKAGGPLAGGVIYTSSIASSTTNAWVDLNDNGSAPQVTVSVQNTTTNLSTCAALSAIVTNASGTTITGLGLNRNTGHEFILSARGRYYLHFTDESCNPGSSPATSFTVTITPATGVS